MNTVIRSLTVALDGEPFSFAGRIRLRGDDALSLFPALFTLELWNLTEESYLKLFRARRISVSHEDACLVSGTISDVYRQPVRDGVMTTVAVSLGLELWESVISLTVPAGTLISDAVRQILIASGTGICLLADLENDSISARPQSFFGRAAECIANALERHSERSEESPRAMLTPSGLMVVPPEGLSETVQITAADLTDTVSFAGGPLRGSKPLAILSASVSGWRPGQAVEVRQGAVSFRGIVVSRSVDADTSTGPWKCEMIVEVT